MNTTQLSPTPVNSAHSACELRLTLIDQALLGERLRAELLFLFRTARNDWPTFKSDPTAYLGRKVIDCWQFAVQKLRTPHLIVSNIKSPNKKGSFRHPRIFRPQFQLFRSLERVRCLWLVSISIPHFGAQKTQLSLATRDRNPQQFLMDQELAAAWGMAMVPASVTDMARELDQASMETSAMAQRVRVVAFREAPMETVPLIRTTFGASAKCSVRGCCPSLSRSTPRKPGRTRSQERSSCA